MLSEPTFTTQVLAGDRFQFGKNWADFLKTLKESQITSAEKSLTDMLQEDRLDHLSFLDAGSGSGLSSLVARKIGARVTSFDFDPQSVACTTSLKQSYFPNDPNWTICQGSVLDDKFLKELGEFDIVYSWGVLHHTGHMWKAMQNAAESVKPGGRLFIMIYSDLGWKSTVWKWIKRFYCSSRIGQLAVEATFIPYYVTRGIFEDILRLKNPMKRYREYSQVRGMSKFHDWRDWLGGLPL